jgi:pimeloyl-ACP methyl ester carboxylesterase
VVLVHGAFADASSWNGVIKRLQAKGVQVTAAANPLRGISIDSAYIAGLLEQTPGPVLAVGHSYGGAVITNAATQAKTSSASSTSPLSPPKRASVWPMSKGLRRTAS